MSTFVNAYTVSGLIGIVFVALAIWKPQVSRVVMGLFFLTMALAVNIPLITTAPNTYVDLGRNAYLPFLRWIFTEWVAWSPRLFVIPVILFQITMAVLMLSKGFKVKVGLFGAMLFCLGVTPFGPEELTAPIVALAFGLLLRHTYERSLPEMFGVGRKVGPAQA